MSFQFEGPFVLASTASEARLGLSPASLEAGTKATVDWWRARAASRG